MSVAGDPRPTGPTVPDNPTRPLLLAGAALLLGAAGFWITWSALSSATSARSGDSNTRAVATSSTPPDPRDPAASESPPTRDRGQLPTKSPRSRAIDSAQHRAIAVQIRERLAAARPAAREETSGDAGASEAQALAAPTLPRDYIVDTIQGQFVEEAKRCYDARLQVNPDAGGKVLVSFTVFADEELGGVVDEVQLAEETEMTDEAFTDCLRASMYEVLFDPPSDGGSVTITYPLVFAAG